MRFHYGREIISSNIKKIKRYSFIYKIIIDIVQVYLYSDLVYIYTANRCIKYYRESKYLSQ